MSERTCACGNTGKLSRYKDGDIFLCPTCYGKARHADPENHGNCTICDRTGVFLYKDTQYGANICKVCYGKALHADPENNGNCTSCGSTNVYLYKDTKHGTNICVVCYEKVRREDSENHGDCTRCDRTDVFLYKDTKHGANICEVCYGKAYNIDPENHGKCSRCGNVGFIAKKLVDNICLCQLCHLEVRTHTVREFRGYMIIMTCDHPIQEECCVCGNVEPVHARVEELHPGVRDLRPVCSECYNNGCRVPYSQDAMSEQEAFDDAYSEYIDED